MALYPPTCPTEDAIHGLFPNSKDQWDTWLEILDNLDIETVGDIQLIDTQIWETLKIPLDLKSKLATLRQPPTNKVSQPTKPVETQPVTPKKAVEHKPGEKPKPAESKPTEPKVANKSAEQKPVATPQKVAERKPEEGKSPARSASPPPDDRRPGFSRELSDEDLMPGPTTTVSKTAQSFAVIKGNKYGVKQNRVIVVDEEALTLKFCDPTMKLRSEVPISQLALMGASDGNDKKIALAFKQRSRIYDISFSDAKACTDFRNLFYSSAKAAEKQKQQSSAPASPVPSKKDEFVAMSAHQEYLIVKKNKFKQRQQRFIVLKPASLVLLDPQRKFKKAFPYDQIHSLQVTIDDKKQNSGEAEAFLLFKPRLKPQRPFQLLFPAVFDRSHFAQCLKRVYPKLVLQDENSASQRFVVTKTSNKVGNRQGKQVIFEVLPEQSVVRSYNRSMQFKDIDISRMQSISACPSDPCKVILTTNQKQSTLAFQDHLTRARFLAATTFMLDSFAAQPPGKKLSVFVGTWNVDGTGPADTEIGLFVPPRAHDIYAIAIQECAPRKTQDWFTEFHRLVGGHESRWGQQEEKERHQTGAYYPVCSQKFLEMGLIILVRKELAYKVTSVECSTVGTGVESYGKGAIVACFQYEDTSLCFVACHLTSMADMSNERRQDIRKIIKVVTTGRDKEVDLVNQNDHVFWFGDLNYRVDKLGFETAVKALKNSKYEEVLSHDQLRREMGVDAKERVFPEFQEGRIAFAPTSRRAKTIDSFVNKRDEPPSYTDRVLYHSVQLGDLTLDRYESVVDATGSDHRPVRAIFTLAPRPFAWGSYLESPTILTISMSELSLLSDQLDMDGEFQIIITAPFMAEPVVMKESGFTGGGWSWWSAYTFRAFVEPEFLAQHHLLVAVKDTRPQATRKHGTVSTKGGTPGLICGYCTLPLMQPPCSSKFGVSLTKDGVYLGLFSGTLSSALVPNS